MTRDEAAEFTRKLLARAEINAFPGKPKRINNIPVFYFEAVLSALRGPERMTTKYNEYAEDGTVIKKTKPRRVFGLWTTFQGDGFRPLVECATLLSESLIDCVLDNGKPDKVEWVAKPLELFERRFCGGHDASLGWKAIYGEKLPEVEG